MSGLFMPRSCTLDISLRGVHSKNFVLRARLDFHLVQAITDIRFVDDLIIIGINDETSVVRSILLCEFYVKGFAQFSHR